MSEQGWREFLGTDGLEDWVVLHGGATAVFCISSMLEATKLAGALANIAGFDGSGSLITVSNDRLSVRLSRDLWELEAGHVELARAVSAVAREHAAVADRSAVQEVQLAISSKADNVDVEFWRAVLGYAPMADDNAVDPLGHGSTVWMQPLDEANALRHAMHVDVSVAREHVVERLSAALAAGGRIVDESQAPAHWTLLATAFAYVPGQTDPPDPPDALTAHEPPVRVTDKAARNDASVATRRAASRPKPHAR